MKPGQIIKNKDNREMYVLFLIGVILAILGAIALNDDPCTEVWPLPTKRCDQEIFFFIKCFFLVIGLSCLITSGYSLAVRFKPRVQEKVSFLGRIIHLPVEQNEKLSGGSIFKIAMVNALYAFFRRR
jgi:hypothetical protein